MKPWALTWKEICSSNHLMVLYEVNLRQRTGVSFFLTTMYKEAYFINFPEVAQCTLCRMLQYRHRKQPRLAYTTDERKTQDWLLTSRKTTFIEDTSRGDKDFKVVEKFGRFRMLSGATGLFGPCSHLSPLPLEPAHPLLTPLRSHGSGKGWKKRRATYFNSSKKLEQELADGSNGEPSPRLY